MCDKQEHSTQTKQPNKAVYVTIKNAPHCTPSSALLYVHHSEERSQKCGRGTLLCAVWLGYIYRCNVCILLHNTQSWQCSCNTHAVLYAAACYTGCIICKLLQLGLLDERKQLCISLDSAQLPYLEVYI